MSADQPKRVIGRPFVKGAPSANPLGRGASKHRTASRVAAQIKAWRAAGVTADEALVTRAAQLAVLAQSNREAALAGCGDLAAVATIERLAAHALRSIRLPGHVRLHREAPTPAASGPTLRERLLAEAEAGSGEGLPAATTSPARGILGEPQFTIRKAD